MDKKFRCAVSILGMLEVLKWNTNMDKIRPVSTLMLGVLGTTRDRAAEIGGSFNPWYVGGVKGGIHMLSGVRIVSILGMLEVLKQCINTTKTNRIKFQSLVCWRGC